MTITAFLSAVLLLTGSVQDAPRVTARVSNSTPSVGETIVYEIAVEGASGGVEINTPNFPRGLILQGTQDYTEMHISFPGGRSQTRRREYALQATSPGRVRISPVIVRVGNTSYRTSAVEVSVSGAPQTFPSVAATEGAYLRANMKPETVYVGQQSTLTIEAGFSDDVRRRLTRPPAFEPPQPTGFWVQDVPGGVQSRLQSTNGSVIEVETFQRAHFPLSAGRYSFAPARVLLDIREGFLFAPETREIRSNSPKITVLPLPEQGRPADFKGAVGSFAVRAFVQPDTVMAGEAAQLTVEVSGAGNIKAAPPPVLPAIPNVEQFAPTENSTLTFDGPIVHGTKQFQWVIIPQSAGTIEVPAIAYSFFDPTSRSYRRATTAPILIHARPAVASASDDAAGATLSALRTRPERASLRWVRARAFLFAQLIPVAALIAVVLAQRVRRAPRRSTVLMHDLKRAVSADVPYPTFLRDIEATVRAAAAERCGDPSLRTANIPALEHALRASAVDESLIARLRALIERLETERFAPSATQAAQRDAFAHAAETVVRDLLRAANRTTTVPAAIALLAALQLPATGLFERGVELHRNGQFNAAARAFESVIAADSQDVAAWSNLGNSYYRAGERGRAVWAWARAARETPRDGNITRNLQAVGAVEVLRTRAPLSVRPVEWYLLAAVGWWIALGVAIAAVLRRRMSLLSWALPAIVVAVIALSVGAVSDGRSYAVALQDQTPMYGDPTIHSPVVRNIQGGAGLDVLEARADWLRVRTVTQAEGWVENDAVGRL